MKTALNQERYTWQRGGINLHTGDSLLPLFIGSSAHPLLIGGGSFGQDV